MFRSKKLVNFIHDLHLGASYNHILDLEKCVETAVINRMNDSGGYCLPSFDKSCFLALDNIDFNEDTYNGKTHFMVQSLFLPAKL